MGFWQWPTLEFPLPPLSCVWSAQYYQAEARAPRLFGCLELLVLLNDDISFLELCQLVLDLVLWEWETTNHIEERGHHFSCQIQLRQAKVFKGSVGCHSILYLGKIVTFQVWVWTDIKDFDGSIRFQRGADVSHVAISKAWSSEEKNLKLFTRVNPI